MLTLNPASVGFAEDLPAAGRCKAARAQTYYDTSSPCQDRRLSLLHSDFPPFGRAPGFGKISTAPRVKLFPKTVYARIQIDASHVGTTYLIIR